jgi:hypothetical protein
MKPVLLLFALICFGMFAKDARAQAVPSTITAINVATGIVSAKVNSTGATIQFKVTNAKSLQSLRVGQAISANLTTNQVLLDGKTVCCSITQTSPASVAVTVTNEGQIDRAVVIGALSNGSPPSSTAAKSALPATTSASAMVPKTSASAPAPNYALAPTTSTTSVVAGSTPSRPTSKTAISALPGPFDLRATQSLSDCTGYAGGGLAQVACEAAMNNHWYILIWQSPEGSPKIDGFKVYEPGGTTPQTPNGPAAQLATNPVPIQTTSPQEQVALLDPAKVGMNPCFYVTAYSGATESPRQSNMTIALYQHLAACFGPANATTPVPTGAGTPPGGSYTQSCQNMYVRLGALYASCKNKGGQWVSTSLSNVSQCNWDVDNDNGTLKCVPPGSYEQTCTNISVSTGTIHAQGSTPPVNYLILGATCSPSTVFTTLDYPNLCIGGTADIENYYGTLACNLPGITP